MDRGVHYRGLNHPFFIDKNSSLSFVTNHSDTSYNRKNTSYYGNNQSFSKEESFLEITHSFNDKYPIDSKYETK